MAIVCSVLGVVLLWVVAYVSRPPTIRIGDIDVNHNMALVRIEGTVVDLRLDPERNRFTVVVDDGTGRINLNGFDKLRRFREALGESFPRLGDRIAVRGTLSISDQWGISMFLTTPARLELRERPQAVQRGLGELARSDVNRPTVIRAQVVTVDRFRAGVSVLLRDDTGELALTLFNKELDALPSDALRERLTTPGSVLELLVRPTIYRDELRLRLLNPADEHGVRFIEERPVPAAPAEDVVVTLADLLGRRKGAVALVRVRVDKARRVRNVGRALQVSDATEAISLFIREEEWSRIPDAERLMIPGTELLGRMKLSEYRGEPQLRPHDPAGIRVIPEGGA